MDTLSTLERQQEIIKLVTAQGKASVKDLAERFAVSEVTIRSDLTFLNSRNLLVRSRGGAVVNSQLSRELSLKEKHEKHHGLKRKLGQAVAALVNDEERIILDSGTTTEEVAIGLRDHRNLIVMTNGLNIANELAQADSIEVMLTGGVLRKKSMSFYGTQAEQSIRHYHFDKVILGVDGFDMKTGLTTYFEPEASLNRLMCEVSSELIVVTDSSKFDRRGFHIICAMSAIHTLVTDTGIPAAYVDELNRLGVRLQLVDKE